MLVTAEEVAEGELNPFVLKQGLDQQHQQSREPQHQSFVFAAHGIVEGTEVVAGYSFVDLGEKNQHQETKQEQTTYCFYGQGDIHEA